MLFITIQKLHYTVSFLDLLRNQKAQMYLQCEQRRTVDLINYSRKIKLQGSFVLKAKSSGSPTAETLCFNLQLAATVSHRKLRENSPYK